MFIYIYIYIYNSNFVVLLIHFMQYYILVLKGNRYLRERKGGWRLYRPFSKLGNGLEHGFPNFLWNEATLVIVGLLVSRT